VVLVSEPGFEEVRRFALRSISLMLALGLVTLALAPLTGHYRGFYLSLTLGGIIVLSSAVYLPIIYSRRGGDARRVAVPAIQSLWVSTSMGLGYVVTALAPYFRIAPPVAVTLFAVGWVMLVYGLYALVRISRQTGVPLAV
jgi:hypothetical protein